MLDVRSVAQTNIALYRQMHDLGYAEDDLALARRSYALATSLFTSQFRATEKPFLCHLVGTASIMAQLKASSVLVSVGLLHAAYEAGNFGSRSGGATNRNRALVRGEVGVAVEQGIFRYSRTPWDADSIARLSTRLAVLTNEERDTLMLRLANELEDHLDLAMCYCHEFRRQIDNCFDLLSPMADASGFRSLAEAFRVVQKEALDAGWSGALATGRKSSYRADPRDCYSISAILGKLRL